MPVIKAAVEGTVDEAVVKKLNVHTGGSTGTVYGKKGKEPLRQKIDGYNNAARHGLWIVLACLERLIKDGS